MNICQSDLNRILANHERYLARRGGMRAVLRSANLEGMILANRNLSEADLSGATLTGANLHGTNLTNASLYCANLCGTDLRNARMEYADVRGASFQGANLGYAVMNYADLRAASMMYVGQKIQVKGNGGSDVPFGGVDFSNCSLRNASFGNAKLDNANFTDALLHGAMFRGARLSNVCFRGAILLGVNLAELNVPAEALKDCVTSPRPDTLARARELLAMIVAHHEWATSDGRSGRPAVVDGEDLSPLGDRLKGLRLPGLSARKVNAVSVDFSGCELQGARFDDADLRAANFAKTDLCGVTFDRAKLGHADFRDARIDDLVLRNGQVLRARADKARAAAEQFRNAKIAAAGFLDGLQSASAAA